MSFLGIIANQKHEEYMKKIISKYIPIDYIIFINDKNINNMKNIKFNVIVMDKNIKKNEILKNILKHSRYVVLNSDMKIDEGLLENLNLEVITYGFNSKATFTISSVEENKIIICLQRIIKNIYGNQYEPQEFEIIQEENREKSLMIATKILSIMMEK